MKLAVTGKLEAGEKAPFVFRGPYEKIIPQAAAIGYDAMELHIHDSAVLDRDALKGLFEQSHITLSSIGTGSAYAEERLSLSSDDDSCRAQAMQRIRDHIVTANDYDAVVIVGLIKGLVADCRNYDSFEQNLRRSLDDILKTAADHRVILVLEIQNRYESDAFNTIDEGLAFLETYRSEWLALHIDTYHMNIEEPDIGAGIRRAKGKISHCHIADSDRWYAGHGHYDFRETVNALRDIGYQRALSVESFMFPNSEESAKRSLETLKRCFLPE